MLDSRKHTHARTNRGRGRSHMRTALATPPLLLSMVLIYLNMQRLVGDLCAHQPPSPLPLRTRSERFLRKQETSSERRRRTRGNRLGRGVANALEQQSYGEPNNGGRALWWLAYFVLFMSDSVANRFRRRFDAVSCLLARWTALVDRCTAERIKVRLRL